LIQGGDIWSSVPGNNDDAKIANIIEGVRLARLLFPTSICTHSAFSSSGIPAPTDFPTTQNWAGFLCGFWGGPISQSANCSYYYGNTRDISNLINSSSELPSAMQSFHQGLFINISTIQYQVIRDYLVNAIAAVSGDSGFAATASSDLDANLQSDILFGPSSAPCPTAAVTIQWSNPTTAGTLAVKQNDYVTWVWADSLQHAIMSTTAGTTYTGAGGSSLTLATSTACITGIQACTTNLGSFNYTYQYLNKGTFSFQDYSYPNTMTGTIAVAQPTPSPAVTSTTTTTTATTADGTGILTSSEENSQTHSGASLVSSWCSFF
jgi:hypothetical protein